MDTDPRFPIGRFQFPEVVSDPQRTAWIGDIERLPVLLQDALEGLSPDDLDTPYRPGGWTVRQVVHHLADSHMNAFIRFKLALTEEEPTIKPYHQERWSETEDSLAVPPSVSLRLLQALHHRWAALLHAMVPEDFRRTFRHPEQGRLLSLEQTLALYAWHGRHHVAHILQLRAQSKE